MKNYSRAYNRWKAKCKFEKRLKLWFPLSQGEYLRSETGGIRYCSSEEMRDNVREGKSHTFLKWTSTPCSCGSCAYYKYDRVPKYKIKKQVWDDIQDENGLVV